MSRPRYERPRIRVEKFIEKLGEKYNIRKIAFDRWGAVQMVPNLESMGFAVVPFRQGFKDMSLPTKESMKLTLERKLARGGHSVLRWMMGNIFIRTDPAVKDFLTYYFVQEKK